MAKKFVLPSDLILRTRWYIYLRWFLLIAICSSGLISLYVGEGWSAQVQRDTLLVIAAISSNGIFYVLGRLKRGRLYYSILASSLIIIDVLFVTYLIFTKGGIESRSPILYAVPILIAAAIFGRTAVYVTAVGALVAYDSLIVADYMNVIHSIGTYTNLRSDFPFVLNTVIFFSAILLIIGFLADYITHLLTLKERQASATAEALKRAQSIAKLGSWEWDIRENKITWSTELHKIFDIRARKRVPTFEDYLGLVHPDDRELVQRSVRLALTKLKPFSFDHRIVRPGRTLRHTHAEGKVIVDKEGKPIKLYGTARDITEERALEKAKGDFVSLASHQLRTPATGVKVLLSLLREGYAGELTNRQKKLLEQAYEANERQLQIANDLLNVARVESGRLTLRRRVINAGEWLEQALGELKQLSDKHTQSLMINVPNRSVRVFADPERLFMVIDNLISNARKYTPEDGVITVTLEETKTMARIKVADTGIGIAPKDVRKLFHRFSRIDSRLSTEVEGSGLGLYLAHSVIKLHKGTIKVQSKLGQGSTFIVNLPKDTSKAQPLAVRTKRRPAKTRLTKQKN